MNPRRTPPTARLRTVSRRLLTVPLATALVGPALALALLATVIAPVPLLLGRPLRLLRFAAYLVLYLLTDLVGVVGAGWIWLRCLPAPGAERAERRQTLSYALLARLLGFLRRAAGPVFGLRVLVHPTVTAPLTPSPAPAAPVPCGAPTSPGAPVPVATTTSPAAGTAPSVPSALPAADAGTDTDRQPAPLLVFARHAGPGDSFLLIHALLCDAGLRPQVVLKQFLQWDPCLDILISRLPHCFVPPGGGGAETADTIADLAAALRPGDAVVLFPEGGNFTEQRRRHAIAWLRRTGQLRRAARAQQQHHVLPPRMPGSLALLSGTTTSAADVVFVAHTGLDRMDSPAKVWRGVPLQEPLRAGWWRVPGTEVPTGRRAQEEWLTDQWSRVDEWIVHEQNSTRRPD